jgi:type II secretory pathway component PulK
LKNRPGVALMLVLWLIVVLGTITSGVVLSTRSTTAMAANHRARVTARYAAESGITIALATLKDSLAVLGENAAARREYLNRLDAALGRNDQVAMGEARLAVALLDVGALLDVNAADVSSLTRLLSYFTDGLEAESAARAIRTYITGGDAGGTDLSAARPLESLEELERVPGLPRRLAEQAAPFLTVDGDGTINTVTASDTVRAAAGGELRDEPSRILIVSRGWREGNALTHEIQAVYAVAGSELTLVRWRERDL